MAKVAAGDGKVEASTMTRMQELGSAWVFKRAIQDNKKFTKWEDIRSDKVTFDEIKKIWKRAGKVNWIDSPEDLAWLENFFKQQGALIEKIGRPNFTLFTRDSKRSEAIQFRWQRHSPQTFMEWVTEFVGREFKIGNKDNWNPADIWLIRDERKWKKKIEEIYDKRKDPTKSLEVELAKFNALFRYLYMKKQIIGISLKKVGKTATYKEVNVSGKFFRTMQATHMELKSAKCLLGTKKITEEQIANAKARGKRNPRTGSLETPLGKAGAATIESQDTVLMIFDPGLGPEGEGKTTYKVQIKGNNSTGFSNLKWEPTIEGKSKARMGKATVALVLDLMRVYGMMKYYEPDNKAFPDDQTDFSGKVVTEYKTIIKEMMTARFVDFGPGVDVETAIINIRETFNIYRGQPWVASSKLQQIRFLYSLFKLSEKDRSDFCTSLIFTAGKEGKRYGPYGKIF